MGEDCSKYPVAAIRSIAHAPASLRFCSCRTLLFDRMEPEGKTVDLANTPFDRPITTRWCSTRRMSLGLLLRRQGSQAADLGQCEGAW